MATGMLHLIMLARMVPASASCQALASTAEYWYRNGNAVFGRTVRFYDSSYGLTVSTPVPVARE